MVYKVLIADDEPIVRKAMQTLIEWEKLECDLIGFAANAGTSNTRHSDFGCSNARSKWY